VDRLLSDGYAVTVFDDLSSGSLGNIAHHEGEKEFHCVKGDIRDAKFVRKALKSVEAVMHLAALVGPRYSKLRLA
jgi:UDP-glucose 4-epimerase